FGLVAPNRPPDGFVGIGTNFAPGDVRVATILHEITHAMGRVTPNRDRAGVTSFAEMDLMRFTSLSNRLFDGTTSPSPLKPVPAAFFSLDGGVTILADWGRTSDPADFLTPPASNRTPNDLFNEIAGTLAQLTIVDIQQTEALGFTSLLPVINPAPPAATTAVMVLRQTSASFTDGSYQIWDIGNHAILPGAVYHLA